MKKMTMRSRMCCLIMFVFFLTPVEAEQYSSVFPHVPDGFQGTPIRGLALGQSRPEVEAVLLGLGKRCFTDVEVGSNRTDKEGLAARKLYVESYEDYSTCRITNSGDPAGSGWAGGINLLSAELVFGMPIYAVSFLEDKVAAISLTPDFFNAQGTTPEVFAQAIFDNYPVQSFDATASGWKGLTSRGELIQIWRGNTAVPLWMTIFKANENNTPTFN